MEKKNFLVHVNVPEVRHYTFTYRVEAETEQEAKNIVSGEFEDFIELEPIDETLDNYEWMWEDALIINAEEE